MKKSLSPLRYPGGKYKIYDKVKNLIEINGLGGRSYVEPFAGGFGIGLGLLRDNIVETAILNDFDSHIYNFWYTILNYPEDFLRIMLDTPVTITERERQKRIYDDVQADQVSDGFATFFLNRVNFSGVITGGPIGGFAQSGSYKLDCRFNKADIQNKVEQITLLRDRIEIYNYDASELIARQLQERVQECFFNIDPPYVEKGHRLYTNFFKEENHRTFERTIAEHLRDGCWIITYDDCELIREIYKDYRLVEYNILHNAGGSVQGKEVVITNIFEDQFAW